MSRTGGNRSGEAAEPFSNPTQPAPDRVIARRIWALLLATVVGLLPFTAFSAFLVPIAESAQADESAVGSLRGLGGVAALVTGVVAAPLLARWPRHILASAASVLLAGASVLATLGSFSALLVFCASAGLSTALLTPVLLTAAVHSFASEADGGRAATLVTATQTLAAIMAAPVLGGLALWGGWRTPFWVSALLALLAAVVLARTGREPQDHSPTATDHTPHYRQAFRRLRSRADLLAAISISALRTTTFMGQLAFLAVVYHRRFDLDPQLFTLVWTLSGAAFFLGNYLAGRWARDAESGRGTLLLLFAGAAGGLAALPLMTLAPWLWAALVGTALLSIGHAVLAAGLTNLLARRGQGLTTMAFSLNGAGQGVGVFTGAALGGLGLSTGGLPGLTAALSLPMVLALALLPLLRAWPEETPSQTKTESREESH